MLKVFICLALPLLFSFQEVFAQPAAPTSGGDQVQCVENPVQLLTATATAPAGSSVKWYNALTGGNVVATPILNTVGTVTYYAAAVDGAGIESLTRTAVKLTINPRPNAPSARDQTGCFNTPATPVIAVALPPAGSSVVWYDALTGGNVVANPSLSTVGSRTYYAASKDNATNCESFSRTPVTLTMVSANISIQSTRIAPAICITENGAIDISVTGGTSPYDYFWRGPNDFQSVRQNPINMPAGSYTVNVTDRNGCIQSATFNVPLNQQTITVNSSIVEPLCTTKNGEISLNISGGTRPYRYSWTGPNGFTSDKEDVRDLEAGDYTVIITDVNGCTVTKTFNLKVNQKTLVIDRTVINPICTSNTGSISITVTNGRGNLSYLWSNNATTPDIINVPAGTYTVNVTDGDGCKGSETFTLASYEPTIIVNGGITKSICTTNNGAININLSGGYPAYSTSWTGPAGYSSSLEDINNLAPGDYTLQVIDNYGCKKTSAFKVDIDQQILSLTETIIKPICTSPTGTITVAPTNGTGSFTYLWSNSVTTADNKNIPSGNYTVTVTDVNGCKGTKNYVLDAEVPNIIISAGVSNAICTSKTGEISVSISGGNPEYTTTWTGPNGFTAITEDITGIAPGDYTINITDKLGCQKSATYSVGSEPRQFILFPTVVNSVCTGAVGSISLWIFGGKTPFTYLWSNGATTPTATGLSAGNYSVVVTDAYGCTAVGNYTVGASPSPIVINGSAIKTICTGKTGAVNVNIAFGTVPYTFKWTGPGGYTSTSEDISGLSDGDYTIEVTDKNGCKQSTTFKVLVDPQVISLNQTIINTKCTGNVGSITLAVTGGTSPYTYQWSNNATTPSITDIPAGNYSVIVTDKNGCTANGNYVVGSDPSTLVVDGGANATICTSKSGSVNINLAFGTTPYKFSWTGPNGFTSKDEDITGLDFGDYTVEVTDRNGCKNTKTYKVDQILQTLTITNTVRRPICTENNGVINITVNGGTRPYKYQWTGSNGFSATTEDVTNLPAGTYTVVVTDQFGCSQTQSFTLTVNQQLLFIEGTVKDALCANNGAIDLDISGGRPVYVFAWTGPNGYTSTEEDLTDLPPGQYNLYVYDANGCDESGTFEVKFTRPVIAISYSVTDPTCTVNTGSIKITAPAPAPEITYSIDGTTYTNSTGIFDNLTPGNYNITAKSGDCISDPVTATIKPAPSVPSAPTVAIEQPTCSLNTGKITVSAPSGSGYSYSINGTDFTNTTGIFPGLSAGTYSVTVKNVNGCISPGTPATINNALTIPVAPTLTTEHPTCSVSSGKITINTPAPAAGISYSINGTDYTNTTGVFPGLTPGNYNVTVKNSDGCISPATPAIIQKVLVAPNAAVATLDQPTCTVNTGKITITSPTGAGLSYSIDGTNYTNTTGIFSPVIPGTYNITVKNADGCISPAIPAIINNALTTPAAPTVNSEPPVCTSNSGKITITAPTGAGLSYSTDGTDYTNTTGSFTNLAEGSYSVTAKNSSGCISAPTPVILVKTTATITISEISTESKCGKNNGAIDLTISGTGTTPLKYSWTGPSGFSAVSEDLNGLAPGDYSIEVTDANGCKNSKTIKVVGNNYSITVNASAPDIKCNETTSIITASANGGTAPYQYSIDGGAIQAGNTFTKGAGTYKVAATDANGCTGEFTVIVKQVPGDIVLIASAPVLKCGETNATIIATASKGTSPYQYSIDGGAFQDGNTFSKGVGSYKIIARDINGCTVEIPVVVTQVPTDVTVTASAPVLKCGETTVTIAASASKGTPPYQYAIDGGSFQAGASFLKGTGTYKITVKDANGCTADASVTVTQVPTDIEITASAPDMKCGETTVTITAVALKGTLPYLYSIDGGTFQAGSTFSKGPGTYKISVKDANGCIADASVTVKQVPADVAITASAPDMKCIETTVSITANATKGTAPYQYSIDGGSYQVSNTFARAAGTYKVSVKDDNGCTADATVIVKMVPSDISLTASAPDQKCNETSVNITASASKGTPPYEYSINGGTFQASNIFSKGPGTYKITARDANGCTADFNITVNVVPADISLTTFAPDLKCSETTVNINASASKGTAPYQYAIDGGTFQDANIFARGVGTYKVTARDVNGCSVDASITVKPVVSDVTVTASAPQLKCGESAVTITAVAQKGTAPYQYTIDGGAFQTGNTFSRGPGTYKVTAKDVNGCTNDATVTILPVPADLTVSASAPQIQCSGTTALITAIATKGTAPYQYSFDGGTTYQSGATFAKDLGTHKVMAKDANGCIAETTVTITVFLSDLNATTVITPVKCGKTNGAISVDATGGTGAYSYSINGGAFQANKNFSNLAAGVYKVNVKDANGCTKEINATVNTTDSDLSLAANAPDLKCGESTVVITATASNGAGTYQYSIDGGALQTGNTFNRGVGTYKISVQDAIGCIVEASVTVKSVPADIGVTAAAPQMKCDETTVIITATASKGTGPYQYSIDGGAFQNANTFSRGTGSYKITAKDQNGCVADVSVNVTQIVSDVTLTVIAPDLKCDESTATITATASKGTAPYQYAIDGGTFQAANTFTRGIGTYKITAKDANGCTTDFNITVKSIVSDLEATVTATDTKCGASIGNINITATKGVAPYAYSLNGGPYQTGNVFSNLAAGNYTINVKDANGCIKNLTATVTNAASDLALNASAPDLKCGETTVLITATANKGTAPYQYAIDGGTFQAGNTFNKGAGTYKISAKDANGCLVDFSITVKNVASDITVTASAPDVKCGETTVTITATASKGTAPYEYAIDGGTFQPGSSFTRAAGSYKISARDANGCIDDYNIIVKAELCCTVELKATAPDVKCGETTTTITANATKGTEPYQYSIDGSAFQAGNTFTKGAGTYKISTKDANGCTTDFSITVKTTVSDLEAIASAPDIKCGETNGTITVTATKGTSPYSYSLDGGATQTTNTFSGLAAGSYKITVKDANGCGKIVDVQIKQVASDITLTVSADDIACGQNTTTITAQATKGTPPYQYAIDGSAYQAGNTFIKGAGTYKISAKDANNCIVDFNKTVKAVVSDLETNAAAPDIKCGETNGTITVTASKGTAPYSYSLNGGAAQTTNVFANLLAGSYKITVKDAGGCTKDIDVTIKQVASDISVTASAPDVKCSETTVTITAEASKGTAPYLYAIAGGTFQAGNTFTKPAGTYKISAKDANGCIADFNITVKAELCCTVELTATAPDVKCGETTTTITATATKGTEPYQYSIDGGAFQSGNTFIKPSGTYKLTAKDANGCTVDKNITVKAIVSDLEASASAPDIKCGETNGTITVTATKGTSPYNYSLDGGAAQTTNSFSNLAAGSYKITVKDANGCTKLVDVTIKQVASDISVTATAPDVKCSETTVTITAEATKGTAPYLYAIDGGAFQAGNTFTKPAGTYKVSAKDANGCIADFNITVKAELCCTVELTATAPDVKCGETTTTITADATKGTAPYLYAIDGGAFQSGNTFIKPAGTYKLTAKDANGCTVDKNITVKAIVSDLEASASAPDIKCGETNGTITVTATKGTSPYSYSLDGGAAQTTNSFSNLSAGSYKITVKDANGCSKIVDVTIKQVASDIAVTASAPDVKCGETTVTITAEATKGTAPYLYAIDGGTFQAGNTFAKPAGTYKISAKDANGCVADFNITVKAIVSDLEASASAPNIKCGETIGTITVTALKGKSPYTYSLDGGAFQNGNVFSNLPAGSYKITVKDAGGCTKDVDATIKQIASNITITATGPDIKCGETTTTITANGALGTEPYQYAIDGGTYQTGNTFTRGPGDYKISAKDANGCIADINISVKAELCCNVELTVNASDIACGQTTTTITATASKGTEPYQYGIDGGAFQSANTFSKGPGTYKIAVKDANGCAVTKDITVNAITSDLDATASAPDIKCGETNGTITVTATKGTSPYNYSLDGGAAQTTNSFSNLAAGSYKITVKDANGCTKLVDVIIKQVASDIAVTASAPDVKCSETTVTITAEATKGTAPYLYAIDGGTFQAGNTFTKPAGTYKISAKDANGCIADLNITVKAEVCCTLELTITAPDVKCGETTTTITATATKGTPPYQFAIDGGIFQFGNAFTKGPGNYKISTKDANGCIIDKNITVIAVASDLDATTSAPDIKCGETNGTITVTATKGTSPYSYSLDGGAAQTTNTFSNLAAGSYKITVKDANGCSKIVDVTIKQLASDISVTASAPDVKCSETTVTITAEATKGTVPYLYAIDGGTFQAGNTFAKPAGTYKISAKDANGCIADFNITVKANPADLTATASTLESTCNGSNGAITISASKGTTPYTYSLDGGPAQPNNSFMLLKAGNYKVTVKDAGGCTIDLNAQVKENCCVMELTVSAPDIKCGETTTVITADAIKGVPPYQYSIDGGAAQASNSFTRAAGTYKVSVKDATGCIVDKTIIVKPLVTDLEATASAPDIKCGETNGTITVAATKGTSPYTYSLNGGAAQNNNVFTNLGAGIYKIIVQDANGCAKQVDVTLKQTGSNLGASATSPVIPCNSSTGVLTVIVAGGIPPYSYSLDGGTPQAVNIFTGLKAGKYKVTVQDGAGCSVDTYTDINETCCTTELTATAPDVSCGQSTTTITATASKGTSPYQYAIDGGTFQNGNTFTKGPGTYKISAKDAAGCIVDLNITVKSSPSNLQASAIAPDIACGASNGQITISASLGTSPYSYSLNGGTSQASNIFNGLKAGNYKITVTDAAGCSAEVNITIRETCCTVELTATAPDVSCGQTTTTITATATKGTTPYQYAIDGGAFQATNTFNKAAGSYKISVKDATGCIADYNIVVKASLSDLEARADAPDITCGDTKGTVTVIANKGKTPYSYSINGGAFQASNSFANLSAGNYAIVVRDAGGCLVNLNATLKISSTPNLVIVDPSETCAPATVDLTAGTITAGSEPGLTYTYWQDAAATQSIANPKLIDRSGQFYIKAVKSAGCTITKPVKVAINPVPTITMKAPDSICTGLTANIEITHQGTAPWSFQYSDGSQTNFVSNINSQQYTLRVNPAQGTTYTITSVSDRFCTNRSPQNNRVTINVARPIPGVRLNAVLVSANRSTSLKGRSIPGYTYNWEPAVGLNNYTSPTPSFNYNQQVDYRIRLVSSAGCTTVDTLLVKLVNAFDPAVSADFFLPNAFSPNGDGRNDLFFPFAVNIRELRYFRIFNRWGELVFETKTFGEGWNGLYKGMKQSADSYFWTIEGITEEGKTLNKYGNVLLLK